MARGDHIKVRRFGGVYSHHGIDLGDGSVIHFSGEPLQRAAARVCRVPMAEFLRGGRCKVVQYARHTRSAEDVIRAALSFLDTADYSLWRNNCEHFATFCKTGKPKSRQVRRAIKAAAGVTACGVVLAGILGAVVLRQKIGGRSGFRLG